MIGAALLYGLSAVTGTATPAAIYPKGVMLNLDFQDAQEGLIPNKGFYPLYVPQGTLAIEPLLNEPMLVFTPDTGLDIPHSSLIQPDGNEWVVSVQLGAHIDGGDGLVVTQGDAEHGYAIYLKDGVPHAVVRTGNCAMMLREDPEMLQTDCRKQMTSIELRIKSDSAQLIINRNRVSTVALDAPLNGDYMPIRIGAQPTLPPILKNFPGIESHGFSGAISSFAIWRQ